MIITKESIQERIESMANDNYYCMYQQVGNKKIIYGIGISETEAITDARMNAEDGVSNLVMAKCTKAVYEHVISHGGDGNYIMNDRKQIDIEEE